MPHVHVLVSPSLRPLPLQKYMYSKRTFLFISPYPRLSDEKREVPEIKQMWLLAFGFFSRFLYFGSWELGVGSWAQWLLHLHPLIDSVECNECSVLEGPHSAIPIPFRSQTKRRPAGRAGLESMIHAPMQP